MGDSLLASARENVVGKPGDTGVRPVIRHIGTAAERVVVMDYDEATRRRFEDELGSRRGVLRSCLLILLDERPGHGYDLLTRLEPLGFDRSNPGRIYRALRWLETAGYVQPNWETTGVGPARRVYELSAEGRQVLEVAAASLRKHIKTLDPALARYLQGRLKTLSGQKQSFEFLVEAKVSVAAADEQSARRKVDRLFGRARPLDGDVRATGQVWVYASEGERRANVS